MAEFLVKVWTYYPYKIEDEKIYKGSSHSVAISRAIKKFRTLPKIAGKKVETITASAQRLK